MPTAAAVYAIKADLAMSHVELPVMFCIMGSNLATNAAKVGELTHPGMRGSTTLCSKA